MLQKKTAINLSNKFIPYISWGAVLLIIIMYYIKSQNVLFGGDDVYYINEVSYFAKYGFYNSLSQGSSFVYTFLIFLFSKIFFVNFFIAAKILNLFSFFIDGFLLLRCFSLFQGVTFEDKYFSLIIFSIIAGGLTFRALPDLVSTAFLFSVLLLIGNGRHWGSIILAAVLFFLSFAVKPIVLISLPGLMLFLLFRFQKPNWFRDNFIKCVLFSATFIVCLVFYQLPSYTVYHRLMLEDKNHYYENNVRKENAVSWNEKNIYFEVYNPQHKPNKWAVTFAEVDSFKEQHPDINLNISLTDYIKSHPSIFIKNISEKIFFDIPYDTQRSFFYSKWTSINKYIHNIFFIKLISLFIFSLVLFFERKHITSNSLLYFSILSYYFILSFITVPQLEGNWLIYCLPFFAIPIIKFVTKRINIFILIFLQFIYFIFM